MRVGTRIRHIQNPQVTGRVIGVGTARFRGQMHVLYDNGEIFFTPARFLILDESYVDTKLVVDDDPRCMEDELADAPEDFDADSTHDSTQTESDGEWQSEDEAVKSDVNGDCNVGVGEEVL